MANMKLIVLFISMAIPSSLSQGTSCTQQEVPENVINCTSIDSVFLSCACSTYKPSILEIMGKLSCLIPGLNFGMDGSTTIPPPVTPPFSISPVSPTLYPAVVTEYVTAQSQPGIGGMGGPFGQQMVGLISNISAQIGEEVFDKICEGISAVQQCVTSDFKQSTKVIDAVLRRYVNLDNLEQAMSSICNIKSEISDNFECLTEAAIPMSACASLALTGSAFQQQDQPGIGELQTYCPLAGDVSRCMSIQAKRCSNRLGTALANFLPTLFSDECNRLSEAGTNNPLMATPVMCALPLLNEGMAVIGAIGPNEPTGGDIQTLVGSMINVYCGGLENILTCIHDEIPGSMNAVDKLIQSLADINQLEDSKTVAQYICDPSRTQAIKDMIPCVMNKNTEAEVCFGGFQSLQFNTSPFGQDPVDDRSKFCGPIQNVTNCMVDSVITTCDASVAAYTRDIMLTILRTDCNGARNGPLQSLINAQRGENAAATLTSQKITFIIAIISLISFLLL
ncbi:uncharacterized protein [Argopecten irradians]|uniref:uncharacterized protein n=1 Tax=Argopecten irradians TaxID=31199 RepID=UPI00371F3172